jgi:hypothetical protein
MTLRLAAFQHFCGQVARAGGVWADALLTRVSPLTYERGDFLAADALADKEAEEEVAEPSCVGCGSEHLYQGSSKCARCIFNGPTDSEAAAPPVASVHPAAVDDAPPVSPAAGFSLPMFKASDLIDIAAEYIAAPVTQEFLLAHPDMEDARTQWSRHVAELVVSALTFELQGLAYDQSHPQTQQ